MHKCIFCLEESRNFNTIEHIIPESLGNTEDTLQGVVCDKTPFFIAQATGEH
jgi:hypothetical protein